MSKLDDAIALLNEGKTHFPNSVIAKIVGCDEGIVRRARNAVQIQMLNEEAERLRANNLALEAELAQYRRAGLPPRRDRFRPTFYPLFEAFVDGQVVPIVTCLGEQP